MSKGGYYRRDLKARSILRYGAVIAAVSLVMHGLLVQSGALSSPEAITSSSPNIIVISSMFWLLFGAITFLSKQLKSRWLGVAELAIYYAMAIFQTIFVSGVNSPFVVYWAMLLIATFAFLGSDWLKIGIILFITTLCADTLLGYQYSTQHMIISIMTAVSIITTSLILIAFYSDQQSVKNDLIESREKENIEHDRVLTLVNNLTDAVFSTDQNGIVTIYNAAALNLLDTNDRIGGQHISKLLELETADHNDFDIFKELKSSTAIHKRDDIIMMMGEDDHIRLEVTLAPVQGGESMTPDGFVVIMRDITKMKSLEEERDEFISVVSHELRTPITIAEGSLSNAQLMVDRGVTNRVSESLAESHKQVMFLAKMVNDLSTLSRAERGVADSAEIIDLVELASRLHHDYAPQAEERGLKFNIDVDSDVGSVQVSRLYLKELLQNFITNSLKYTQKGSVTLHIKKKNDLVEFAVSDTGIGISKSDQKKVFDRFYRVEDYRTRETSGTGLGLYVSAKLARKLKTKIKVESRLNHGSSFSFCLKPVGPSDS